MNTAATILTSLKNVSLFEDIYFPNDKTKKTFQNYDQFLNKEQIKEMENGLIEKAKTFSLNNSRFSNINADNLFGLSINDKIEPCLIRKTPPQPEPNVKMIMTIACIVIAAIATAVFATLAIVFSSGLVPLVVFSVLAGVSGCLLALPSSQLGKINKEYKEEEKQKQTIFREEKQNLINDLADNFLPYLIQTKVIHRIANLYNSSSKSADTLNLNHCSEYTRKGFVRLSEPFLNLLQTRISNGENPEQAYLTTMNNIERAISLKASLGNHPMRYRTLSPISTGADENQELSSLGNSYFQLLDRYWAILDNWHALCGNQFVNTFAQPLPELFLPKVEEVYNRLNEFSRENGNDYRSFRKLHSEAISVLPELQILDCRILPNDPDQIQTNMQSIDAMINRIDSCQTRMNGYFAEARRLDGCRQELADELNNMYRVRFYAHPQVDTAQIITKLRRIRETFFPGRSFT